MCGGGRRCGGELSRQENLLRREEFVGMKLVDCGRSLVKEFWQGKQGTCKFHFQSIAGLTYFCVKKPWDSLA